MQLPPIVNNGIEEEYEMEDEDYLYDGPAMGDVGLVIAQEVRHSVTSSCCHFCLLQCTYLQPVSSSGCQHMLCYMLMFGFPLK